jgi:hypothetical protein
MRQRLTETPAKGFSILNEANYTSTTTGTTVPIGMTPHPRPSGLVVLEVRESFLVSGGVVEHSRGASWRVEADAMCFLHTLLNSPPTPQRNLIPAPHQSKRERKTYNVRQTYSRYHCFRHFSRIKCTHVERRSHLFLQ